MSDLIDRQVAIDTLDKHLRTTDVPVSYPGIISALTEWLNELPSAQPDSKELSFTQKKLDTISRQAAIDAMKEHRALFCDNTPDTFSKLSYAEKSRVDELDMAIATLINLPSAQPEQRWIPVAERLPEDGTEVFIYLFDRPSPYIAWIEDTHWYTEDFEVDREDEPIAWMPLPEPYAERKTDE